MDEAPDPGQDAPAGGEGDGAVVLLPYIAGSSGGASGVALELGMVGGLVLAAIVKWGLRFAWKRLSAPRGRHRGGPAPRRPGVRSPLSKCRTLPVR